MLYLCHSYYKKYYSLYYSNIFFYSVTVVTTVYYSFSIVILQDFLLRAYMSFRTLNDLERRNGRQCALSYRIWQSCQALSCSWSWRFLVLVLVFVLTCMVLFNPLDAILPLDVRVFVSRHYFLLSSAFAGPEHSVNAPMPDWPVNAARCLQWMHQTTS